MQVDCVQSFYVLNGVKWSIFGKEMWREILKPFYTKKFVLRQILVPLVTKNFSKCLYSQYNTCQFWICFVLRIDKKAKKILKKNFGSEKVFSYKENVKKRKLVFKMHYYFTEKIIWEKVKKRSFNFCNLLSL